MEKLRANEKNIILAILICGLVVSVGTTFAFFTAGADVGGDGTSVNGETAQFVEVTYDAGNSNFDMLDAVPGSTHSKAFNVTVKPNSTKDSVTYMVKLNIGTNGFNYGNAHLEELKYTLTEVNSGKEYTGYIPLGTTGNVELAKITKDSLSLTTYNYTLKVDFLNVDESQNRNANKSLSGNLIVEFAEA